MVLRRASTEKVCSECNVLIGEGNKYFSGPYKALCMECGLEQNRKKPEPSIKSSSPKKVATKGKDIKDNKDSKVPKKCFYCSEDDKSEPVGVLYGKSVCLAHINNVLTENV